jgi:hypothetical protein
VRYHCLSICRSAAKEVKRAFELAGWLGRRGKGHTVFTKGSRVVDDDVKRFSSGLLAAMRRQSGLSREEFIEHLKRGKR